MEIEPDWKIKLHPAILSSILQNTIKAIDYKRIIKDNYKKIPTDYSLNIIPSPSQLLQISLPPHQEAILLFSIPSIHILSFEIWANLLPLPIHATPLQLPRAPFDFSIHIPPPSFSQTPSLSFNEITLFYSKQTHYSLPFHLPDPKPIAITSITFPSLDSSLTDYVYAFHCNNYLPQRSVCILSWVLIS